MPLDSPRRQYCRMRRRSILALDGQSVAEVSSQAQRKNIRVPDHVCCWRRAGSLTRRRPKSPSPSGQHRGVAPRRLYRRLWRHRRHPRTRARTRTQLPHPRPHPHPLPAPGSCDAASDSRRAVHRHQPGSRLGGAEFQMDMLGPRQTDSETLRRRWAPSERSATSRTWRSTIRSSTPGNRESPTCMPFSATPQTNANSERRFATRDRQQHLSWRHDQPQRLLGAGDHRHEGRHARQAAS